MQTRAALFHAPGQPFEVIELDKPRADEVVVRMAPAGICGTNLHQPLHPATRSFSRGRPGAATASRAAAAAPRPAAR